MKQIELTQNKIAIVDNDFCAENKWCFNMSYGSNGYAVRNIYPVDRCHPKKVYLHRIIIKAKEGDLVDHINRNTLDNRKENLRISNRSENTKNSNYYQKLKEGVLST